MIRVLICDDQDVVREGLRTILSTVVGIEVVALAEDGARAVEMFERHKPDMVLMDLNMPGVNGIQATRQGTRWMGEGRGRKPQIRRYDVRAQGQGVR